jgi:phosphoribosylformylglycinamidine cyclo-ligase
MWAIHLKNEAAWNAFRSKSTNVYPCDVQRYNSSKRALHVSDAYARAGVDISAGNEAVSKYREVTADWRHPNQLGAIGGFSGLFKLPEDDKRALVASTDGVGTKILLAARAKRYDGVGADLVNHCVNDILVTNAVPLFFLDYLAIGKLDPAVAGELVAGVQRACRAHSMALLGGETAEMPGLYAPGDFDLAGTIVGIVDRDQVPDPVTVAPGDVIVGLPAIGLHTNGYSLARAVFSEADYSLPLPGDEERTILDGLLTEHPSYYEAVRTLQKSVKIKSMAHITGGGLLENVPRTLPEHAAAIFDPSTWIVPPIFSEIVKRAQLTEHEQYRTFNMGVGFTLIVEASEAEKAVAAWPGSSVVGKVVLRESTGEIVRFER